MSNKYLKVPIDWIIKRSELEAATMQVNGWTKLLNRFSSYEKKKEKLDSMEKSLGRIEMLKEVIETYSSTVSEDKPREKELTEREYWTEYFRPCKTCEYNGKQCNPDSGCSRIAVKKRVIPSVPESQRSKLNEGVDK